MILFFSILFKKFNKLINYFKLFNNFKFIKVKFIILILFFNLSLIINLNCQNFKYNDEKPKPKPPGVWKLKDYNVNPEWTEEEKKFLYYLLHFPIKFQKNLF